MTTTSLHKGEIVQVFHDYYDEKRLEGYAQLIEYQSSNIGFCPQHLTERWKVKFQGDQTERTRHIRVALPCANGHCKLKDKK